jgi:hypothetical protein
MLILLLLFAMLVSFKPIHTQVVHQRVAHQCQTPLSTRWITFTVEPSLRVQLLILSCHNKLRPACMGKKYTHTAPNFTIPNPSSTPYTSEFNGGAYPNSNNNFQAPHTTIAYTDPVLLPDSSLGFLPNHDYQTLPCFNAYGQSKISGFGYETPPQLPFRP